MTRIHKTAIAMLALSAALLVVPASNLPRFMLATPPPHLSNNEGVIVFVSKSEIDPNSGGLKLQLTVINQSGKRIHFRGQSPTFGAIGPYYAKQIAPDGEFQTKPIHCGNCWCDHSLLSGFGTTFDATLWSGEKRGRYGFIFGNTTSGPFDQISWSEAIALPE